MTGDELRSFRERRGLKQGELAQLLNEALGRNYSGDSIGRWERGKVPVSKQVATFLSELEAAGAAEALGELGDVAAGAAGSAAGGFGAGPATADTAPGFDVPAQPVLLSGGGPWVKACTELWEMVATGVGMVGAATGNEALEFDGAVIAADKEALGQAWGKLAETNDTLRRMLTGMTEGGVWLQVALVTSSTFSKCWQGHVQIRERDRYARQQTREHTDPDAAAADAAAYADPLAA